MIWQERNTVNQTYYKKISMKKLIREVISPIHQNDKRYIVIHDFDNEKYKEYSLGISISNNEITEYFHCVNGRTLYNFIDDIAILPNTMHYILLSLALKKNNLIFNKRTSEIIKGGT